MQTIGTPLLAINRCSLARVRLAVEDRRGAPGLLYFAAVQHSPHVGGDPLVRRDLHELLALGHMAGDLPRCRSLYRVALQRYAPS